MVEDTMTDETILETTPIEPNSAEQKPVEPKTKKVKKKKKVSAFAIINGTVLSLFAVICLFPFLTEVLTSFASVDDFNTAGFMVIPYHFNFESYKYILYQGRVGTAFLNSLFTTAIGTLYCMLLTIIGSYVLCQKDMVGSKFFFYFVLFTMFFGGGLIPFFITVRGMGLMNSLWSVIIPFGVSGFNMIILRNYFSKVPQSVLESCKIDGGSQLTILCQFVLPLSKAGLATVALFYLVERWNDWYWPMLFITDSEKATLSLELRNILMSKQTSVDFGGGTVDTTVTFGKGQNAATVVLSILPILLVYPFVQKYFVQGVMIGSIKE